MPDWVPDWVPDGATDLKEVQRTTGDERILSMRYTDDLPAACVAIATPGAPQIEELIAGLKREPGIDQSEGTVFADKSQEADYEQ